MSPEQRKNTTPRTIMIGGKAFATYTNAKRIVKLVNDVGAVVNTDPEVNNFLKVICNFTFMYIKAKPKRTRTFIKNLLH